MSDFFGEFQGNVFRVVETQEVAAPTRIVRDLADQSRLEELLDASKPGVCSDVKHYLLTTPFRYPPLSHGSRFGGRFEPSLFYGSRARGTCLAECAYYRLMFYVDMQDPPPNPVTTQHTIFQVLISSAAVIDLRVADSYDQGKLRHPSDYTYTQLIGTQLRERGTEVLLFGSARDPHHGTNLALYSAGAFAEDKPHDQEMCHSQVDGARVVFRGIGTIVHFPGELFCDEHGNFLRATA